MRRHRRDGQTELRLHLLGNRLCVIADHAADAGVCNEYGPRMVFVHGKADAFAQPLLPAEDRLTLPKPARQERHGRKPHGCPRRSQAVKTAHVHAVRDVRARARTVKDDDGTAHKGQRTPNARHATAAVRAAYADALYFNSHSAPPAPRAPRTPSASARSASRSYRLPVRAQRSAAPAPTPARRR